MSAAGTRGAMELTPDDAFTRLVSHRWVTPEDFDDVYRECVEPVMRSLDLKQHCLIAVPVKDKETGEIIAYAAGPLEYHSAGTSNHTRSFAFVTVCS